MLSDQAMLDITLLTLDKQAYKIARDESKTPDERLVLLDKIDEIKLLLVGVEEVCAAR